MGVKVVLVLGPDEAAAGSVTVKDLVSGTQETLSVGQVLAAIRKILERG
jgi:histidyl-tRNA synthetase